MQRINRIGPFHVAYGHPNQHWVEQLFHGGRHGAFSVRTFRHTPDGMVADLKSREFLTLEAAKAEADRRAHLEKTEALLLGK